MRRLSEWLVVVYRGGSVNRRYAARGLVSRNGEVYPDDPIPRDVIERAGCPLPTRGAVREICEALTGAGRFRPRVESFVCEAVDEGPCEGWVVLVPGCEPLGTHLTSEDAHQAFHAWLRRQPVGGWTTDLAAAAQDAERECRARAAMAAYRRQQRV